MVASPISLPAVATRITLGSLSSHDACIVEHALGRELQHRFAEQPELPGLVIISPDNVPRGMVSRRRFMEIFSKPYRNEIYSERTASTLLKELGGEPLVFEADMLIDDAAQAIARRAPEDFSEPVVLRSRDAALRVIDSQVLLSALAQGYATQYRELQMAQTVIVENEKLASLGRLVAGIAHEINTPLGIGITAVSAILDQEAKLTERISGGAIKRSEITRSLEDIHRLGEAAQRTLDHAADLVRSFKQVAADQTSELCRTFDLCEELRHIANSLQASAHKAGVSLRLMEGDAIEMHSYPGAITQVTTNLVLNALLHAFEGRTECEVVIEYGPGITGEVEIAVSDNGNGIAPEQLERIFEPFYTTKRGNGGTGLGLSIVHNIARATLGGSINVHSSPGNGTRFSLLIPRTR